MKKIEDALRIIKSAHLKPSVSLEKEFKELIIDIAYRDNLNFVEVVLLKEVNEILNNTKLSGPQKLKRIKKTLMAIRYPSYTKAKEEFKRELKALKLHPNIKVRHSPYFENDKLEIDYTYKDENEFAEIKKSLKKLEGAELVKNVLKNTEDNC